MTKECDRIAAFKFATDNIPENERVAVWTEEICRVFLKVHFEPLPSEQFYQEAVLAKLPGLSLMTGKSSGWLAKRTAEDIAQGGAGLSVFINLEGAPAHASQSGEEETVEPGQALLLINEQPGSLRMKGACRRITVTLPSSAMVGRDVQPYASAMRKLPRGSEALRLLTVYLSAFDTASLRKELDCGLLGNAFVSHVHDLLALMLQPSREAWDRAKSGLKAARLHAIKNDVLSRLSQADLSLDAVAARQGVSQRYVQRLFEEEGTSFTAFMLNARLARAQRMLADERFAGHTIAAIAYEAGFPDLSNFNRFFRRQFGMTPSDVRAAAKGRAEARNASNIKSA